MEVTQKMMKAESVGVMGHKHDEIVEELPVFKITMSLDNAVDCLKNAINDTVRGAFGIIRGDIDLESRQKIASVYESLDHARDLANEVLHNTNLCEKDENKSPIITLNLNGDDIHGMIIENFNPIVK